MPSLPPTFNKNLFEQMEFLHSSGQAERFGCLFVFFQRFLGIVFGAY